MALTTGSGLARTSCPAIAVPWMISSTAARRPWAGSCCSASGAGRNTPSTTPAATAVAPNATTRTPRRGWRSGRQELLPVPYFHVVFTLPQELRELVRRNQKDLYDILLRAAAQSLIQLAADPHDVGGLIGVLGVLHTWTRALVYHPHVHCLVPAGGLSADRTVWRPARQTYLVPVHALSKLFRGLFLDLVRQARPDLTLPEAVWTTGGWSTANRPCKAQSKSCHTWAGMATGSR
jgi:Putative transposase